MTVTHAARAITQAVRDHTEQLASEGTVRHQFVALTTLKRDLDAELRRVKDAIREREQLILDQLADTGDTGYQNGGRTVYITRKVWARAVVDKPSACDALRAAGLGAYVEEGFNTNSLSAHFRELRNQQQPGAALADLLPEPLADAIALTEDHSLGVR